MSPLLPRAAGQLLCLHFSQPLLTGPTTAPGSTASGLASRVSACPCPGLYLPQSPPDQPPPALDSTCRGLSLSQLLPPPSQPLSVLAPHPSPVPAPPVLTSRYPSLSLPWPFPAPASQCLLCPALCNSKAQDKGGVLESSPSIVFRPCALCSPSSGSLMKVLLSPLLHCTAVGVQRPADLNLTQGGRAESHEHCTPPLEGNKYSWTSVPCPRVSHTWAGDAFFPTPAPSLATV